MVARSSPPFDFTIGLGTIPKVQRRRQKEIHCKGGRGSEKPYS